MSEPAILPSAIRAGIAHWRLLDLLIVRILRTALHTMRCLRRLLFRSLALLMERNHVHEGLRWTLIWASVRRSRSSRGRGTRRQETSVHEFGIWDAQVRLTETEVIFAGWTADELLTLLVARIVDGEHVALLVVAGDAEVRGAAAV